ncbi:helix-turn-helix domain-containing protein [Streptomyces sp. SP17BM10]|uniref:helix-turn-helix transcriptional regulator n=1 Tax=Streptomyces sp. SP17BM10 TaxID=3002530 RepID=UPI002E770DC1|nr:helix-turn-helix domain-containing protein [Streptomyces sp. SP17BM10]MEE1782179.1 helix-turn-helix domain-containing protein [Streptomyces sp. SP17BM10]
MSSNAEREPRTGWTFLTQHARILVMASRDPDVRLRDLAAACGLTERAVRSVVADLERAGYLTHERVGRRNRYRIVPGTPFRHPAEGHLDVDVLLHVLDGRDRAGQDRPASGDAPHATTSTEAPDADRAPDAPR